MQDVEETIEGFYFEDEAVAGQARREYLYIEKMKDKVAALKPAELKDFYEKLLEKKIFSSQIGYTYLYEIRSTLEDAYHFPSEELADIVIPAASAVQDKLPDRPKASTQEGEILSLKRTRTLLGVAVVLLIIVVIGFFVILATNQNIGYVNTENKILDKYSGWQEELEAKEQELDSREQELEAREQELELQEEKLQAEQQKLKDGESDAGQENDNVDSLSE